MEKEADHHLEKVQDSLQSLDYIHNQLDKDLGLSFQEILFEDLQSRMLKLSASLKELEKNGTGFDEVPTSLKELLKDLKTDVKNHKASDSTFMRARQMADICQRSQKHFHEFKQIYSSLKMIESELYTQGLKLSQFMSETKKSLLFVDAIKLHSSEINSHLHYFRENKSAYLTEVSARVTMPDLAEKAPLRKFKKIA